MRPRVTSSIWIGIPDVNVPARRPQWADGSRGKRTLSGKDRAQNFPAAALKTKPQITRYTRANRRQTEKSPVHTKECQQTQSDS